jgi:hypothetical protein
MNNLVFPNKWKHSSVFQIVAPVIKQKAISGRFMPAIYVGGELGRWQTNKKHDAKEGLEPTS